MKKFSPALAALTLSVALSACSSGHNSGYNNGAQQNHPCQQQDWQQHKEHMNMMAQNLFNAIDTNGDGVISQKEYNAYFHKWFKEADTGHNNELTFDEFKDQLKREKKKLWSDQRHDDNGGYQQDNGDRVYNDHIHRGYDDRGGNSPDYSNQSYNNTPSHD